MNISHEIWNDDTCIQMSYGNLNQFENTDDYVLKQLAASQKVIFKTGKQYLRYKTIVKLKSESLLAKTIQESKVLLTWDEDWDEEGALKPSEEAYSVAIEFLTSYYNYIENVYGVRIKMPYIDSKQDGSIYLAWEKGKTHLLIIFKRKEGLSYFYGENYQGVPFKGGIPYGQTPQNYICDWMQEYLK